MSGGGQAGGAASAGIAASSSSLALPAAEWNDGEYVSLSVASLDDLEPKELVAAPVMHLDGRADH